MNTQECSWSLPIFLEDSPQPTGPHRKSVLQKNVPSTLNRQKQQQREDRAARVAKARGLLERPLPQKPIVQEASDSHIPEQPLETYELLVPCGFITPSSIPSLVVSLDDEEEIAPSGIVSAAWGTQEDQVSDPLRNGHEHRKSVLQKNVPSTLNRQKQRQREDRAARVAKARGLLERPLPQKPIVQEASDGYTEHLPETAELLVSDECTMLFPNPSSVVSPDDEEEENVPSRIVSVAGGTQKNQVSAPLRNGHEQGVSGTNVDLSVEWIRTERERQQLLFDMSTDTDQDMEAAYPSQPEQNATSFSPTRRGEANLEALLQKFHSLCYSKDVGRYFLNIFKIPLPSVNDLSSMPREQQLELYIRLEDAISQADDSIPQPIFAKYPDLQNDPSLTLKNKDACLSWFNAFQQAQAEQQHPTQSYLID